MALSLKLEDLSDFSIGFDHFTCFYLETSLKSAKYQLLMNKQ